MKAALANEISYASDKARHWTDRRDRLVVAARAEGASLREIADLVGMTHPTIARILRDAEVSA